MATRAKMKEQETGHRITVTRTPSTSVLLLEAQANPSSFLGMIIKAVSGAALELLEKVKQDVGKGANVSKVLSELFMWNWIRKFAENKYDTLMDKAKESGVISDASKLEPGNYTVAESRHFVVTAGVTEPIRRFNPDALCQWAFESHKIPIIVMKEQIEKAKLSTKSTVRLTIEERS